MKFQISIISDKSSSGMLEFENYVKIFKYTRIQP